MKIGGKAPNLDLNINQKKQIFDKALTSLIINVPKEFQPDIINFLTLNSKKLIKLVHNEISADQMNSFGLFFNITLKMSKIHLNEGEESIQPIYIVSPRYIVNIAELQTVLKLYCNYSLTEMSPCYWTQQVRVWWLTPYYYYK